MSVARDGVRQVRCIGADEAAAAAMWNHHVPDAPIRSIGPDPRFPRCVLMLVPEGGQ